MNRRGFAYIVAVLILGLLAFMALFLMQSSSTEYSQAAVSCYATIAQQLAEAAADEAFSSIEALFRNEGEDGWKGPLLRQAATSDYPPKDAGKNPKFLDVPPDFNKWVPQTKYLLDYHITRAGFKIDSVRVEMNDIRPIDYNKWNTDECMYKPKDRKECFDTLLSRDYYMSLTFSVKVIYRQGSKEHKYGLRVTRDMKIINDGPTARNYTLFSCFGADHTFSEEVQNDLTRGKGKLVLWNNPFQSRVYIHGPAVIGLENPDYSDTTDDLGALRPDTSNGSPGPSHAFQFSDTYNGLSYLPFPSRALWEGKDFVWWNNALDNTKHDYDEMSDSEKTMFKYNTYVKGLIPKKSTYWEELGKWLTSGTDQTIREYMRGAYAKQMFLPAGPYCRFPWKYVPERRPGNFTPNQKFDAWPDPDPYLRIEHRYLIDGDTTLDDNTKIYAEGRHYRLINVGGVSVQKDAVYPKKVMPEFSLCYGNYRDPEKWWEAVWDVLTAAAGKAWSVVSLPAKLIYVGAENLVSLVWKAQDPTAPAATNNADRRNLFPQNFKNYSYATVMKLKNVDEIPQVEEGGKNVWLLDGQYWLDSFETTGDVVYKGKGVIYVSQWIDGKPATIRGSIKAWSENDKVRSDSHLTIIYYPFKSDYTINANECQLVIEGTGHIIEASVFSLCGIRTTQGILEDKDYEDMNMNPAWPMGSANGTMEKTWMKAGVKLDDLQAKVNSIVGNYVNFYMKKFRLDGDLWVFHDVKNPFYFRQEPADSQNWQLNENFTDDAQREKYELMVHTVHLSPKIQHIAFSGATE